DVTFDLTQLWAATYGLMVVNPDQQKSRLLAAFTVEDPPPPPPPVSPVKDFARSIDFTARSIPGPLMNVRTLAVGATRGEVYVAASDAGSSVLAVVDPATEDLEVIDFLSQFEPVVLAVNESN